jgi:phosphonatase-like hydrolase
MPIRLVVFDLAGTTLDDRGAVNDCMRGALADAGVEVDPAAVDAVMGLPKPEAIRLLVEGAGKADALRGHLGPIHDDFVARMLRHYREDPEIREVPGASEVFRRLKALGIAVAINTGFSRSITNAILDRMGWERDGLIDSHVSSDEVAWGRPHPDMIRRLMSDVHVTEHAEVAKVGDAPADLHEGANAGCGLVVGVTWGSHRREELAGHPHTHLIDAIEDLLTIVTA